MDITFIGNQYDTNPRHNTSEKTMLYLIGKKGKLSGEGELHVWGIFESETWRRLLKRAGFRIHEKKATVTPKNLPVFSCLKICKVSGSE